jgi:hypothetical protein
MPEGSRRSAPAELRWADGWTIGEPDAVIPMPEPFDVPAEGMVEYQYMYVKTDFAEDRWVQAMEIRPTAPQVTHHVLVFLEEPDAERKQGGIAGFFAGYAPGNHGDGLGEATGFRPYRRDRPCQQWHANSSCTKGTGQRSRRTLAAFGEHPAQHVLCVGLAPWTR